MIIPCIDLMDGKVVQLVQGRERVLERGVEDVLCDFAGFPQIQVIDLDAAMEKGSNAAVVENLARRVKIRAGGGVRSVERAQELVRCGAFRVIVGTAAVGEKGANVGFLTELKEAVGAERITIALDSRNGMVSVHGWQEATRWTARELLPELESYCSGFLCTYIDKEGMLEGTDLGWFQELREATSHELIAAGGITSMDDVKALGAMGVNCAIGMAIYTGRLRLDELLSLNKEEERR